MQSECKFNGNYCLSALKAHFMEFPLAAKEKFFNSQTVDTHQNMDGSTSFDSRVPCEHAFYEAQNAIVLWQCNHSS